MKSPPQRSRLLLKEGFNLKQVNETTHTLIAEEGLASTLQKMQNKKNINIMENCWEMQK